MNFRAFAFPTSLLAAGLFAFVACSSGSPGESQGDAGSGSSSGTSSGGSSGTSSGGSSGSSSGGQCLAIEELPAILTVVSATGEPIACDAKLSLVGGTDAGEGSASFFACEPDSQIGGCPAPDGGAACMYAVQANGAQGAGIATYSVEVSQAGFVSQVIANVSTGVGGCVPTQAPSQITVKLVPAPDSGSDAGPTPDGGSDASDGG